MIIRSVNISKEKGTIKEPVDEINLTKTGVEGDAHAGDWNRMVSLLAVESIDRFAHKSGRKIEWGEFAENITTEGIELKDVLPLDRLSNDQIDLEVTQIGKECHGTNCAIFREVGSCVMPQEGIFARVLKEGPLKPGDELVYTPYTFTCKIITLSDRASRGDYEDKSGKVLESLLTSAFEARNRKIHIERIIIPDDPDLLKKEFISSVDNSVDIFITTGGTGIGPRDITPETIRPLLDKEIPGIMEMVRMKYGADKPAALLSRSIAGVKGKTLVYCLPGSPKAVKEYMDVIEPTLQHSVYMVKRLDLH